MSHIAATPPGLEVTATVRLLEVNGKHLIFAVAAHDGIDLITQGTHERFIIDKDIFTEKVSAKQNKSGSDSN